MNYLQPEASAIVNKAYNNNKNFITPTFVNAGFTTNLKDVAFEITQGKGLSQPIIYGVVFVNAKTLEIYEDKNTICYSIEEAEQAIINFRK